eukprot:PhF_6_TR10841/c0_g1_i3/m.17531/K13963/SERPINB; serpin B
MNTTNVSLQLLREVITSTFNENSEGKQPSVTMSPFSVYAALALCELGARDTTKSEIRTLLQWTPTKPSTTEDDDSTQVTFAQLIQSIMGTTRGSVLNEPTFTFANKIFVSHEFPLSPSFLQQGKELYGTVCDSVDFQDIEPTRAKINNWVSSVTNNKIPTLYPAGALKPSRMIAVNACYFKGLWVSPFISRYTQQRPFHVNETTTVQVQMMSNTASTYGWYKDHSRCVDVVRLDYVGNSHMLVIMPNDDSPLTLTTFVTDVFTPTLLHEWESLLHRNSELILQLPKFVTKFSTSMVPACVQLGMHQAFGPGANFSKMFGVPSDMRITDIRHEAFLEVSEEGTEAAAVTAVECGDPCRPPSITIDRPFLYFIRESNTGTILFCGSQSFE